MTPDDTLHVRMPRQLTEHVIRVHHHPRVREHLARAEYRRAGAGYTAHITHVPRPVVEALAAILRADLDSLKTRDLPVSPGVNRFVVKNALARIERSLDH